MADITYAIVKNILDTIYNNISTYDQYPSLLIFENDVRNNDVIFERETTVSGQVRKDVVAMLSNEAYIIDNNTYKVKLLESTAIDQNNGQVKVYDYALSSYVPLSRLVKNICTSLGVKLDDTFADNNRTIYNGMVDIINKFFGNKLENNSLAALKRIGASGSEEYLSFIPKNIIVEFCQYLNDLDLFALNKTVIAPQVFCGFILKGGTSISNSNVIPYKPINELYDLEGDWDKIKEYYKNGFRYYYDSSNFYNLTNKSVMIQKAVEYLKTSYGDEIDPSNNFIYLASYFSNLNTRDVTAFPSTHSFTFAVYDDPSKIYLFSISRRESYYGWVRGSYVLKDLVKTSYSLNMTFSSPDTVTEATGTKTVNVYSTNTVAYMSNYLDGYYCYPAFCNLKRNLYKSLYYSGSQSVFDSLGSIPANTFITPKIADFKYTVFSSFYDFITPLSDNNVEITDKDLYFCLRSKCIIVMKDVDQIKFSSSYNETPGIFLTGNGALNKTYWSNWSFPPKVTFNKPTEVIILIENSGVWSKLTNTYTTFKLQEVTTISADYIDQLNLFGIEEIREPESFEGLEIISGATVPQNVYTESAFDSKYSSWANKSFNDNNVYYLNDQIQSVTYPTKWLPLGVTDSGNASQVAAQGGIINAADIEEIADGIEAAESDEDNPDIEPIDPYDNKVTEDEGTTPDLPALIALPNATNLGFFQHCVIKPEDFQYLVSSVLASIALPDHIISIQMGYRYGATEGKHKIKFGAVLPESDVICNPLTESISNILFEPNIDIQEKYQNYLDIETTSLVIYLPFVGFNNLDIKDFLGKKLSLMARFDTISGTIVYTVASVVGNNTNILYHFQGNCQEQLPFSEDAFAGLLRTTMGVVSQTAIGFAAGKEAGAGLNAVNSIMSVANQEPRIAGSFTANSGFLCGLTPYLLLRRKKDIVPSILPELNGIPANTAVVLGQCKGITKVLEVDLKGIDAFDNELDELKQLLAEGVLV